MVMVTVTTVSEDWTRILKSLTFTNILKASGVLFLITLQLLIVIWIVMWMSGNTHTAQKQPEVTYTETVTETTPTTTP